LLGLALAVAAIAVPDSLNPSLIVAAVYLALGPHPVLRTTAFTAGAFVVTLAGGLLVAFGLGDLILSLLPKLSRPLKYQILTGFGVLLVCGAAVMWWRRRSLAAGEPPSARHAGGGAGSSALLGAGIAGVELLTAFPYFAAIAMVVGSSAPIGGKAALLCIYDLIYVMPLIAITIVCAVMGDRAAGVVAPVGNWIATRWPIVVAPLLAAAGVALATYGIIQLT
jgi:hypothetical protein